MPWTDVLLLVAALTSLTWLVLALLVMTGNRRLRRLARLRAPEPTAWPRVSIVIAARNEAATVGAALPTVFAKDYPELEFIVVNDRSEDDTGAILDRIAAAEPRLRVVHVRELPAGWIGKNHALHLGAQQATGEWILFTDADVHFAPDALARAVAYGRANSLDHIAAVPHLSGTSHPLGICVNAFSFAFMVGLRPWQVPDPRSGAHAGVGAFNLVRASTYRKLGGHEPLRLRPDDDIKLGKLMKAGGFSEFMLGDGAVTVAWYHTVGDMVRGLTKNAYAAADYRLGMPLLGALLTVVLYLWPIAALAFTTGHALWLNAGSIVVMLALGCDQTRFTGGRWWHGLFLPFGMTVFAYALLRSQAVTLWTGGITWRGTHYSLYELRENRL
jgi:cellulose synthase/poly-beta-1,6-N-acetylglucosamine synthase-like glycosyltransferase